MGQSTGSSEDASASPVYQRIERARALAAVHQLPAAAAELENIRASGNDVTLRNVATLMLLGIYLEEGNYGRSQALLDETFQARAAQKDESIRTYFAAAGQTVNGIRSHLARYRSYGINPSDADLAGRGNTDLERVRGLLERVIAQAQEISKEQGRAYEAFALLEDVLGIRLSLARNDDERARWQTEYLSGTREDGFVAASGRVSRQVAGARCRHQQNSQSVCDEAGCPFRRTGRATNSAPAPPVLPRQPSRSSLVPVC